ncbi:MAG TPA: alpha/beta hydrolase [Syntrophales bacterium]|nr:alpha/beta hydrolase [Syntrophales bacterium]
MKEFLMAIDAQRRAANLVKKEVQVEDHKIVYLEGGNGETVVLLHGFGGNKDHWTTFANYLKGYHLVIPDVPGFGESSQVPTGRYDLESQLGRIERFVEVLKLDKFHMAGNSMGGAFTAAYGAKHPKKVLDLALLDTAGAPSQNKSEFVMQLENGNNLLMVHNEEDYEKLMTAVFVKRPTAPESFRKVMIAYWIAHLEFDKKIWCDLQWTSQFSLAPFLPLIQAPVLIIWGDQDKLVDVGGVAFLEKSLKNYRTAIMRDMGHCPMMERPEETAKVYMSFLVGNQK